MRLAPAALALLVAGGGADAQSLGAGDSAVDVPLVRPAGWRLVWRDEFDRPGLIDERRWRYDTSRNRAGWYNDEKQYYAARRRENARVAGGVLTIEARAERLSDRADHGGQAYSSARIDTRGIAAWTYGFYEVRAKLACGRGIWPAIWMLGSDEAPGWPALGEIDVMEHVGWKPGVIHATVHTKAYNHVAKTQRGAARRVPDACGAFHRYQMLWTRDAITIGVDGRGFMRFANDRSGDRARWPFDRSQYLILNLAVGGWGGERGIDPRAFPARMQVDYVRVWQGR